MGSRTSRGGKKSGATAIAGGGKKMGSPAEGGATEDRASFVARFPALGEDALRVRGTLRDMGTASYDRETWGPASAVVSLGDFGTTATKSSPVVKEAIKASAVPEVFTAKVKETEAIMAEMGVAGRVKIDKKVILKKTNVTVRQRSSSADDVDVVQGKIQYLTILEIFGKK